MSAVAPIEKRMLTRQDAAQYLGISLRSLDYLTAAGEFPKVKLAGRMLIDRMDIDAYIERVKAAS